MTFAFPENEKDTAAALRAAEPQAPKHIKALLIQAANELEDFERVATDAVRELTEAADLRIGMMDSQSRADDVTKQIRTTLTSIASRFRALLEKGESDGRRT
jgi:hypothetical protein